MALKFGGFLSLISLVFRGGKTAANRFLFVKLAGIGLKFCSRTGRSTRPCSADLCRQFICWPLVETSWTQTEMGLSIDTLIPIPFFIFVVGLGKKPITSVVHLNLVQSFLF